MAFLGTLFVFGGYILVYASVARGGKFATDPWAGLYADAYEDTGAAATTTAAAPTGLPTGTQVNQATNPQGFTRPRNG